MSVLRAFIAISLPIEVTQALHQVLNDLRRRLPGKDVRWVPAANIHLTIKFLGDVSTTNLQILQKMLQAEAARHAPFTCEVRGLGAFPSMRRARVVWVGVEAPSALRALQRGVENEMARLGYAAEERSFSPHLTLGRVSRTVDPEGLRRIGEVLTHTQVGLLGIAPVQAIHLYQSDLQPGGARYTRLFTAPLAGPALSEAGSNPSA